MGRYTEKPNRYRDICKERGRERERERERIIRHTDLGIWNTEKYRKPTIKYRNYGSVRFGILYLRRLREICFFSLRTVFSDLWPIRTFPSRIL